jgi:hypothetical protein
VQQTDYSMTSSARVSTVGGIVSPIAFAVLRLMTNSNVVGCSIGRSAGFAPFLTADGFDACQRNVPQACNRFDGSAHGHGRPTSASEQHFVGERLLDVLPDHPRHRSGAHQLVVGGNVMS